MLETGQMDRDNVEMVNIDMLVPEDHLLRKIDTAIDFTKIYEFVKDLYSEDAGRPSIDPAYLWDPFPKENSGRYSDEPGLSLVSRVWNSRDHPAFFNCKL